MWKIGTKGFAGSIQPDFLIEPYPAIKFLGDIESSYKKSWLPEVIRKPAYFLIYKQMIKANYVLQPNF